MRKMEALGSLLAIFLLLAAPLSAVSYPFFGYFGLIGAASLSFVGVLVFLLRVESNLEKECRFVDSHGVNLNDNVAGIHGPRLRAIVDPVPRVIVTRSLGGKGLILISQGALTHFSKSELENLIVLAAKRVSLAFLPVCGAGWILKTRFRKRMSTDAPRSIAQMLRDLFIFPYYRFFLSISRGCEVK